MTNQELPIWVEAVVGCGIAVVVIIGGTAVVGWGCVQEGVWVCMTRADVLVWRYDVLVWLGY